MSCMSEQSGGLKLFTNGQLQGIHEASLKVLEEVGIKTDSPSILQLLANRGAEVDKKQKSIKIPAQIIEEALKKAPKGVRLCGRNSKRDILLEKGKAYFGLGGTPTPYFRDPAGKIRRPTKEDVATATRLGEILPNISFIMSIAGSYDVPLETQYLHDFDVLANNTCKPIIYSAPGRKNAAKMLRMAEKIAGGQDQLMDRPFFTLYNVLC